MDFRPRLFLSHLPAAGAERVFTTLAHLWHGQGVDARLGLWSKTGPMVDDLPADLPVDVLGEGAWDNTAPSIERAGRAVAGWMDHSGGSVLMTGMPWANAAGAAARRTGALRGHTWRFVWSERTEPHALYNAMPARDRSVLDGYARLGARVADAATAVSKRCVEEMVERWAWCAGRATPLFNPVRIPQGNGEVHPWLAQPRTSPCALNVARLAHEKGHEVLLKAWALLPAHLGGLRCVVLGEGVERAKLEAMAHDLGLTERVAFAGFGWDVGAALQACDLFVFPSLYEGMPNAVVEALVAGCPIVSTGKGRGAGDVLGDGRFGRLVEEGDAAGMAEAIVQHFADPLVVEDRELERFAPEGVAQGYRTVLEEAGLHAHWRGQTWT
jgi:hypothetical protein